MKNTLKPINGNFSYCGYLDYMYDHFYGVHARTALEDNTDLCYDHNGNLIAFYDCKRHELWAID